MNILFMILPLAIRLKHRPCFLAFVYIAICSMLKSYPSVSAPCNQCWISLGVLYYIASKLWNMSGSLIFRVAEIVISRAFATICWTKWTSTMYRFYLHSFLFFFFVFWEGGGHCFLCYVDKFCAVLNYYLMSNGDIKCSLNVHVLAGLLFAIVGFLFGWITIENITCQLGLRLWWGSIGTEGFWFAVYSKCIAWMRD